MLELLLLQTSLLTRPLYLDEAPPELRSMRHIVLLHEELPSPPPAARGTKEKAREFATELAEQLRGGADFVALAREHSMSRTRQTGGVLGSFRAGMLPEPFDEFLFSAQIGDVSEPIDAETGVHILQRIDTFAGVLQIFVEGAHEASQQRARGLMARIAAGEDFAGLAREHSDDPESAQAGGKLMVFERGVNDRLLKKAAFETSLGEVSGPIATPLGYHILKRVPHEDIDPDLWEKKTVRLRAILVAFTGTVGAPPSLERNQEQAILLATELHSRIEGGEDMALVAREFNDDPTGRTRAGDLGWVHRGTPDLPLFMDQAFTKPVGWLSPPLQTSAGYVLIQRTD